MSTPEYRRITEFLSHLPDDANKAIFAHIGSYKGTYYRILVSSYGQFQTMPFEIGNIYKRIK